MMRRLLPSLLLFGLILGVAAMAYYYAPGPLREEATLVIPRGQGFRGTSDQLHARNIIRLPLLFKAIAAGNGAARQLKAGEYQFPPHISPRDIMRMLVEGRVVMRKITVAEGLTVAEVKALLQAETALTGEVPPLKEGEILPETYHFSFGDARAEIVARMKKSMQETLSSLWEKRKPGLPFTTPEEALTLASIVEKETGVPEERGRVAAVFVNRLRLGMPLQTDPTVAYGIEQQTGKPLGRLLTLKDLETPTPYNTYLNPGLPPGPIANPGKASLEAALNPPETEELYFVATGTGGHRFAKTVEEHSKNVAAYRAAIKATNEKTKQ